LFQANNPSLPSTSNLIGDAPGDKTPGQARLSDQNSRLRSKVIRAEKLMEDIRKEKKTLSDKVSTNKSPPMLLW